MLLLQTTLECGRSVVYPPGTLFRLKQIKAAPQQNRQYNDTFWIHGPVAEDGHDETESSKDTCLQFSKFEIQPLPVDGEFTPPVDF